MNQYIKPMNVAYEWIEISGVILDERSKPCGIN